MSFGSIARTHTLFDELQVFSHGVSYSADQQFESIEICKLIQDTLPFVPLERVSAAGNGSSIPGDSCCDLGTSHGYFAWNADGHSRDITGKPLADCAKNTEG
jgi:hypothetical protein